MKPIGTSAKVFNAYAEIDYCYFVLKEIYKDLGVKQSPIEIMVDEATGYGQDRIKEAKKNICELLNKIIKNKKIIDADYSAEEKMLTDFKAIN